MENTRVESRVYMNGIQPTTSLSSANTEQKNGSSVEKENMQDLENTGTSSLFQKRSSQPVRSAAAAGSVSGARKKVAAHRAADFTTPSWDTANNENNAITGNGPVTSNGGDPADEN